MGISLTNRLLLGSAGVLISFTALAAKVAEPKAFYACAYQLDDPEKKCVPITIPGLIRNDDEAYSPASLNKLMTARLVYKHMLDNGKTLDDPFVTVTQQDNIEGRQGERDGITKDRGGIIIARLAGVTLTYRETIHAMAVKSANNVALAAGRRLAPDHSLLTFASIMNQEAREIGMTGSNLVSASGMPATGQYTTARDMGVLVRSNVQLFGLEQFNELFGKTSAMIAGQNVDGHLKLLSYNDRIVKSGKTGADNGGLNVAGYAERGNIGIYFATLASPGPRAYARDSFTDSSLRQIFGQFGIVFDQPATIKAAAEPSKKAIKPRSKSRAQASVPVRNKSKPVKRVSAAP